jgi:hypothetical protein
VHSFNVVMRQEDEDWLTTMNPLVAPPLAAMLRSDAARISWADNWSQVDRLYAGGRLAGLVLGEPVPGEDE